MSRFLFPSCPLFASPLFASPPCCCRAVVPSCCSWPVLFLSRPDLVATCVQKGPHAPKLSVPSKAHRQKLSPPRLHWIVIIPAHLRSTVRILGQWDIGSGDSRRLSIEDCSDVEASVSSNVRSRLSLSFSRQGVKFHVLFDATFTRKVKRRISSNETIFRLIKQCSKGVLYQGQSSRCPDPKAPSSFSG